MVALILLIALISLIGRWFDNWTTESPSLIGA